MNNPPSSIVFGDFTSPALAMPDEYKKDDVVDSYQLYYIESKLKVRGIVKYTKREWPEFLLL